MPSSRKPSKKAPPPPSSSSSTTGAKSTTKGKNGKSSGGGHRKQNAGQNVDQENRNPRLSLNSSVSTLDPVLVRQIRRIFNGFQVLSEIPKSIQALIKLYKEKLPSFFESFATCVVITLGLEDKSPFTKRIVECIAKFTSDIVKEDEKENQSQLDTSNRDDIGLETFGDSSFEHGQATPANIFVDNLLASVLIPALKAAKHNVRANGCYLASKLINELTDMDENVYEEIQKSLLERMADKQISVRAAAAKALTRFQELNKPEDPVISAYRFHLNNDPSPEVRLAVITSMELAPNTLDEVVARTRDMKDIMRKAAFMILAEKVNAKTFSIATRIELLRNGLNDRSKAVRRVVETKLIPAWLKHYDYDFVELLVWLDIQSDTESPSKMLKLLFAKLLDEVEEGKNKLVSFVEQFRNQFLDHRRLFTKTPLSGEKAFLWKVLAQYCKENEEVIAEKTHFGEGSDEDTLCREVDEVLSVLSNANGVETDVNCTQNSFMSNLTQISTMAGNSDGPSQSKDLLDHIFPDLPYFCQYIRRFTRKIDSKSPSVEELMDFDFMYHQLMEMLLLYDVRDEAQNRVVRELADSLINAKTLTEKFRHHLIPLMKFLSVGTCKNPQNLLQFTAKVIHRLYDSVSEGQAVSDPDPDPDPGKGKKLNSSADERKLRVRIAELAVNIAELRDQLEETVKEENFIEAEELKKRIASLTIEKQEVVDQLESSTVDPNQGGTQISSQASQKTQVVDIGSHPEVLGKVLQILVGCLRYADFEGTNDTISALTDKIMLPGILSTVPSVKIYAVEALGLCCYMNKDFAKKYFGLFVQIILNDVEAVQIIALKSVFDFLCQHGIQVLAENKSANKMNQSRRLQTLDLPEFPRPTTPLDRPSSEAGHSTDENAANDSRSSKDSSGDRSRLRLEEDEEVPTEEDVVKNLTNLIDKLFNAESEELKCTAVKGVAKMLILGRLYSPDLVSRLLTMWYVLDDSSEIRHFIGVFLPIYAFSESKCINGLSSQAALEECYLDTIEKIYKAKVLAGDQSLASMSCASDIFLSSQMLSVNIENMISFVSELILPDGHGRIAIAVCQKMLDILQIQSRYQFENQEQFLNRYLPKCLSLLYLEESNKQQLKDIVVLMENITKSMAQKKLLIPVLSQKRIDKFMAYAKLCLEQIRSQDSMLNDSQTSAPSSQTITTTNRSQNGLNVSNSSERTLIAEDNPVEAESGDESQDEDFDDEGATVIYGSQMPPPKEMQSSSPSSASSVAAFDSDMEI